MKNILIIFLFTIIIVSCNSNSKLFEDLSLFKKEPVNLTKKSKLIISGVDTKNFYNMERGLKYIIYKDSLGCTSCAINSMYLWDEFIEYAKLYNDRLKYYFIYSPSKNELKNIEFILKNGNFNYPILLDTLGEFEKINPHLPKNKVLHTFLLDENNNVILVGDPLYNRKIKKMFYKIVEEKLGKPQEHSVKDRLN